jgi:hypothetical protein
MLDTDDLVLWYALNRLMINYWADVDSNGGAQAHEFYLPDALYVSATTGSRESRRSVPSMLGAGSAAEPPRVTW